MPDLHSHFQYNDIETHMYASQWFLTLFTAKFPLPMVYRIMDLFLCHVSRWFRITKKERSTEREEWSQSEANLPPYQSIDVSNNWETNTSWWIAWRCSFAIYFIQCIAFHYFFLPGNEYYFSSCLGLVKGKWYLRLFICLLVTKNSVSHLHTPENTHYLEGYLATRPNLVTTCNLI